MWELRRASMRSCYNRRTPSRGRGEPFLSVGGLRIEEEVTAETTEELTIWS